MSNIQKKATQDLKKTMEWIDSKENKDWIYNMFIKGPPENKGFMWCDKEGGKDKWWTEKESKGLNDVTQYVLDLGWDSSGYGLFMRKIQHHIKTTIKNKKMMDVWEKEGSESVVNKMMENAGGDYARMRSMYG